MSWWSNFGGATAVVSAAAKPSANTAAAATQSAYASVPDGVPGSPSAPPPATFNEERPGFMTQFNPATYTPAANEERVEFGASTQDAGHGRRITGLKVSTLWGTAQTGIVTIRNDGTTWWIHQEKPGAAVWIAEREVIPGPSPSVEALRQEAEGIDGGEDPTAFPLAGDGVTGDAAPASTSKGLGVVLAIAAGAGALWMFGRARGRRRGRK